MDNNQTPASNNPIDWKSLGFFSGEDYLIYIFKKTEKITSALYLVSALLKDEEPMKWELRDKGMDLLSSSFTASSSLPGDKNSVIQSLFTAALETISLLNVCHISHLISEMNHKLLVREIDQVVGLLKDRLTINSGFGGGQNTVIGNKDARHKGQSESSHSKGISNGQVAVQQKKSQRQEQIVGVLKGQSNLTIKDFSKVIKDCSEKTIQRELLELVDKGVVKKEGERRWSRYSLK